LLVVVVEGRGLVVVVVQVDIKLVHYLFPLLQIIRLQLVVVETVLPATVKVVYKVQILFLPQ
jgi:hypothetical protein